MFKTKVPTSQTTTSCLAYHSFNSQESWPLISSYLENHQRLSQ